MADRYYGHDRGDGWESVTVGSSSTSTTDVEIRVDDASDITRQEVLEMIEILKQAILKDASFPNRN